LQRQSISFGYAAECGEQDLIDTTPSKSHLRVTFIFHISFEIRDYNGSGAGGTVEVRSQCLHPDISSISWQAFQRTFQRAFWMLFCFAKMQLGVV